MNYFTPIEYAPEWLQVMAREQRVGAKVVVLRQILKSGKFPYEKQVAFYTKAAIGVAQCNIAHHSTHKGSDLHAKYGAEVVGAQFAQEFYLIVA